MQDMFVQANQHFTDLVDEIDDAQWEEQCPTLTSWTIKDLVVHVTENNQMLNEAVSGNKHQISSPHDDPASAWEESANSVESLVISQTDLEQMVDGPTGKVTLEELLKMQITDRSIHAWDLSRALDTDSMIDPALVKVMYEYVEPRVDEMRESGLISDEVPVPSTSSLQDRLLGLMGRQP